MAATQRVYLKKSSVSAKVPLVGDLGYGELAVNTADGTIYFKHAAAATNIALNDAIGKFEYKKNNTVAGSPTVSDDASAGYAIGSRWIDTTASSEEEYLLVDASIGAAKWIHTSTSEELAAHIGITSGNPHSVTKAEVGLGNVENLKVNLTAVSAPVAGNDNTQGYAVGSRWIDTSNPKSEYVCVDSTTAAAIWIETTIEYPIGYAIDYASLTAAPVASGTDSLAIGDSAIASGQESVALGHEAIAAKKNEIAFGIGNFGVASDTVNGTMGMAAVTTNATPTEMTTTSGVAGYFTIPVDSTVMFRAYVTARRTDADNESAAYTLEGCVDNNAGVTAIVGAVSKTIYAEDTVLWDVDATADDTNDRLSLNCVGDVGANIRWFARIEYTQITG